MTPLVQQTDRSDVSMVYSGTGATPPYLERTS